jgi:hypothetical protein
MTTFDDEGNEIANIAGRAVLNPLAAVSNPDLQISDYGEIPDECWGYIRMEHLDYYDHALLPLAAQFRKSLNATLTLAYQLAEFEAVHGFWHPLGDPIKELRTCTELLDGDLNSGLRRPT